jgi:quinol monooxygenase YgiN
MYVQVISLRVKPDQIEPFKATSTVTLQKTMQEPEVLRFYFMQQADTPEVELLQNKDKSV